MKTTVLEELYSDDDIIVVNKPSGLLAIPDRFNASLPSVKTILRERYGDIWIVHRLDRGTSGAMIVARTADAHRSLNMQFDAHSMKKLYHALVSGVVDRESFTIDIPITADTRRKGLMKPSARGKEARTDVRVLEKFRVATLIECDLITGRQHQIRVHCSAVGYPLLVDADYGRSSSFLLSSIKKRFNLAKGEEERPIIDRVTLHAHTLTVTHPRTGQALTVTAPYPRDFAAALSVLRKYAAPYASAFAGRF